MELISFLFFTFVPGALLLLGLAHLVLPLLIKFSQKTQGSPQLLSVDPAHWPVNIAEILRRYEHDLFNMGFEISDRVQMPNAMPNTDTILTMFVHRQTGEKAMLTAMFGLTNGVKKLGTLYLEFSSRYPDGRCFDTMNSSTLSSFQRAPGDVKTQVPQVKETANLLRVHRYMVRKGAPTGKPMVYPPGGARNYLLRIWREGFEEQVKFGRFEYHKRNDTFTPSWKGAYLMTWGILWPWGWIRKQQMEARAREVWDEVQTASGTAPLSPAPAPGAERGS